MCLRKLRREKNISGYNNGLIMENGKDVCSKHHSKNLTYPPSSVPEDISSRVLMK